MHILYDFSLTDTISPQVKVRAERLDLKLAGAT